MISSTASLVLAHEAQAQGDPAAVAKETIALVAQEETKAGKARLSIAVTDRRGQKGGMDSDADVRKRVAEVLATPVAGTLVYAPEGWLKDLTVVQSGQSPKPMRVRTAESAGVLRNLMEVTSDGKTEAYGRVLKVPSTAPADAILTRRAAAALNGITWTAARAEGDVITLEGKRTMEQHTVIVAKQPFPYIRDWTLTRSVTTPEGKSLEQSYDCHALAPDSSGISKVEEWMRVGAPVSTLSYRITEIKKFDLQPDLKPAEVQLRFPKGTQVVDSRGEVPLEYEQTAEGINDEELAAAAKALAEGRAKPGDPAPTFELKDVKNKVTRLSDMRGQVVLLFWFTTNSKVSQVGSSRVDLQACKLEYSIVSPK